MAFPLLATLNGSNLPPTFSYSPYLPQKRNSVTKTFGAVITQSAPTQIVHGDGTLSWSIEACYPFEFEALWTLYNTATPTLYTFVGYWTENLGVYFSNLDPPKVRSRLFSVSGMFQVICVNSIYSGLSCNGV